ncbi:hypothetical protein KAX75_02360 [candidate division WOR-3 bacterium]|nr:hypothetical protein [candidate division WOR-3 bacterium]
MLLIESQKNGNTATRGLFALQRKHRDCYGSENERELAMTNNGQKPLKSCGYHNENTTRRCILEQW